MRIFIIDENAVHAALSCSSTANRLFLNINKNGHFVAVTTFLYQSYFDIMKHHASSSHYATLFPIINSLMHSGEKCKYLTGPFKPEKEIPVHHRKDLFLAQIAYALDSPSIIVSSDGDTARDLKKMGLTVCNLAEAMNLAQEK